MSGAPLVVEVPDLAGDAWHLRPWRVDDAASLARAWHDPAVIEGSTPPADRSEAAAARWIAGCEERRLAGVALDLVVAGEDDAVLGEIGLSRFDADRAAAVIGWWLHAEVRGRGVAGAAVTAFTDWAVSTGGLRHLVAEIGVGNEASESVARRAGFTVLRSAARGSPGLWVRSAGD